MNDLLDTLDKKWVILFHFYHAYQANHSYHVLCHSPEA